MAEDAATADLRSGDIVDVLFDHSALAALALALVVLSVIGVGNIFFAVVAGLLLCAIGLFQRTATVDLWVFVPLLVYVVMNFISAFATYGDIFQGYGYLHLLFPIIYLLMGCLRPGDTAVLRRLCVAWAAVVALVGVGQVVFQALAYGSIQRLGGLLSNPNALGAFLVVGWFCLAGMQAEGGSSEKPATRADRLLALSEPLLLAALALTLSLGSFVAMAAGMVVFAAVTWHRAGLRQALVWLAEVLAKAVFAAGTGLLLYAAVARTSAEWLSVLVVLYLVALVLLWGRLIDLLRVRRVLTAVLACMAVAATAALAFLRPSAAATFAERLQMMQNGLGYLSVDPLLGVGPFQWRVLNQHDPDLYFNTWHIHNVPLHVAVEFGFIALVALLVVVVRYYWKHRSPGSLGSFTAFLVHNMADTSFFYLGITALVLMSDGQPHLRGRTLGPALLRIIFAVFGAFYLWALIASLM